jgi:PAS domain-containing protein
VTRRQRDLILDAVQLSMADAAAEHLRTGRQRKELVRGAGLEGSFARDVTVSTAIVALAAGVQWLAWPVVRPMAYLFLLPAIVFGTIYGNGLVSVAVAAALSLFFVAPSRPTLHTFLFLLVGLIIENVTARLNEARRASAGALEEQDRLRREAESLADESRVDRSMAERRAAELSAVIESMPDAVFIGNADSYQIANRQALEQLGLSSLDELEGLRRTILERLGMRSYPEGKRIEPEERPSRAPWPARPRRRRLRSRT